MPKQDKNITEATPEQETAQEATQESQEKGFFGKTLDKAKELASEAKEATQEFFSTDSSEAEHKEAQKGFNTPSLKSITKKYSLVNCLAFQYIGQENFNIRIGSASHTFTQGEVLIVPNDTTAQWLKHKSTLFVPIV